MTTQITMNKIFTTLHLFLLLCTASVLAEPAGTWRLYNSYTNITKVEPFGNYIFVLCDGNLFSYNTTDLSVAEHNKLTGLTSQNIINIAACKTAKKLLIIYEDYTIDFLPTDFTKEIMTLVGLKEKLTSKDKAITDIHINGKYAYITTKELGILKINTLNCTIEETYTHGEAIPDDERATMTVDEYKTLSGDAKPDGPETNRFWKIYLHDGKLFCPAGYYHFEQAADPKYPLLVRYLDLSQNTWSNITSPDKAQLGYDAVDANCMAFDSNDANHIWIGSRSGLFEYKNYNFTTAYNCSNSTLKSIAHLDNNERVLISSMTYDNNGNLWILNSRTNTPINCYSSNSSTRWTIFPHNDLDFAGRNSIDMQEVFISPTNNMMWWINTFEGGETPSGVFVYDFKNDKIKKYGTFTNQNGENIKATKIYGISEDSNGNIWVASTSGPFYIDKDEIPSPQNLDSAPTFYQPVINRDDGSELGDYLLSSVPIRCIRFDTANRKWMGSNTSGVFLISSDNQTEIEHFTTENSPLPADEIYDIKIDNNTGIVYISTSRGLCSYQTDITSGYGTLDEDNIYSYPNPVSPDYTGPITIKGLYEQCQIKITTSTGYIVHKGVVSGGSYKWDGCDQNGDRVASGVYMVLIETPEGSKGCVTKIAILK